MLLKCHFPVELNSIYAQRNCTCVLCSVQKPHSDLSPAGSYLDLLIGSGSVMRLLSLKKPLI